MPTPTAPPPPDEVEILYLDDALVVVSKPSGMLGHRGWGRDRVVAMTVVRDLLGRYVYPVHRLDRGTSGSAGAPFKRTGITEALRSTNSSSAPCAAPGELAEGRVKSVTCDLVEVVSDPELV